MVDGVVIIDKPAGITSHDVVARVRRIMRERRVGHTGTLDPFATGVLVLLIGRATRLALFLSGADKEYEAVVRFGYATETGDATGPIRPDSRAQETSEDFARAWSESVIEEALAGLRGRIEQVPPMHSAKKIKGKKLYELAHRGQVIERAAVPVFVHEFVVVEKNGDLLRHNPDGTADLSVRVTCSAGTYIRALAESLGERLGVGAHLSTLRRTRAGQFALAEAHTLDELEEMAKSDGAPLPALLSPRMALREMPSVHLSGEDSLRVRHGALLSLDDQWPDGQLLQLCDAAGNLIAIGVYNGTERTLRPRMVLAAEH